MAQNTGGCLQRLGFENVKVAAVDDTVYATFEDPAYRGTFRGAAIAVKVLGKEFPATKNVELAVKEYGVDRIAVHASRLDERWRVNVDYNTKSISDNLELLSEDRVSNSSFGKINVTMYPIVSLDNHLLYKMFSYGVMIAPAVETTLWKGNHIVVQPIVPLLNNYDKPIENSVNSHFQLGSVNIQQDMINNGKGWIKVSGGFFHYNYVGIAADCGIHLDRNWDLGLQTSVTRWHDMNDNVLIMERENHYSALLNLNYYEPYSSLQFGVQGGRYIYGDYGLRFDVTCRYGEYCIGVYGTYTGGEENAGFNFSIPLGPKKQKRTGWVSVRLPESFDWEYSMSSNYGWVDKKCGKVLEMNGGRDKAAHYWQAKYIQNYLQKVLDGDVK